MLTYAVTLQLAMVGVGVYAIEALWSKRIAVARLVVSISLAVLLLAFIFFLVPALSFWRSNLLYSMIFSLFGLLGVRLLLGKTLDADAFKRRVLILGAGPRAARVERLAQKNGAGFIVVGYIAMNNGATAVPQAVNRSKIANLSDHVVELAASEVVLALEERRNALPLTDLLRIKTTGVNVNELSSFLSAENRPGRSRPLNPAGSSLDGFFRPAPTFECRTRRPVRRCRQRGHPRRDGPASFSSLPSSRDAESRAPPSIRQRRSASMQSSTF
jgi:FlaA1/EpsC-like NDP-sugar epimerase